MLRDIMGAAGLSAFAQISLLIFVAVFLALALYLFATRGSPQWEKARYMPLDDEQPHGEPRDGGKN